MEWNTNGLLRHQHELEVILGTENIDIYLISETHFTKESVSLVIQLIIIVCLHTFCRVLLLFNNFCQLINHFVIVNCAMYKYGWGFWISVSWIEWIKSIAYCYICIWDIYLACIYSFSFVIFHYLPVVYFYRTSFKFICTFGWHPAYIWLLVILLLIWLLLVTCWRNQVHIMCNIKYTFSLFYSQMFLVYKSVILQSSDRGGNRSSLFWRFCFQMKISAVVGRHCRQVT
jgi:hypothetical protein